MNNTIESEKNAAATEAPQMKMKRTKKSKLSKKQASPHRKPHRQKLSI
jgi:hypothetical protein